MEKLIEDIEKATEGSATLDALIFCALNDKKFISVDSGGIHFESDEAGTHTMVTVVSYTRDLTNAVSLIPEGKLWMAGYGANTPDEPRGGCVILAGNGNSNPVAEAEAATVELAVCAAALKAVAKGRV